jgi:hypothetical protein
MTLNEDAAPPVAARPRPSRLLHIAFICVLVSPFAYVAAKVLISPSIPFVVANDKADWIMYPRPMQTDVFLVKPDDVRPARFTKTFTLDNPPSQVQLHVKALADADVYVNGEQLSHEQLESASFRKAASVDVGSFLRPGLNEIRADVRNAKGPELLHVWLDGPPERLATDETWTVEIDGKPKEQAIVADDTLMHPDSMVLETPLQSLLNEREVLALLFASSCGLFLVGRACWQGRDLGRLTKITLLTISLGWVYLFVAKAQDISNTMGYDAVAHCKYVEYVANRARLPRPDEGWAMYHPPLFYVLTAALVRLGSHWLGSGSVVVLGKIVPFLSGLGNTWLTFALARRVFSRSRGHVLFAVVVAGTLPMNLYLSMYVSNESLHAFLATLCLLVTVVLLQQPSCSFRLTFLAGGLFGLALLAKVTAIMFLCLAICFVAWKVVQIERRSLGRAAGLAGALLMGALTVSGWYYFKNLRETGQPVCDNWGTYHDKIWWQQPGFHTPLYYLTFGEALKHPYLSAYHSFSDGVYSTLWGDGLCSGRIAIERRNPAWRYDYMSTGYLLALPATILLGIGLARMLLSAFRDEDPRRRLVFLLLATAILWMGCALVYYSLMLPSYACAKAFYGLGVIGPLSIAAAYGLGTVDGLLQAPRLLLVRTLFFGWFGTLAAVLYLSYAG